MCCPLIAGPSDLIFVVFVVAVSLPPKILTSVRSQPIMHDPAEPYDDMTGFCLEMVNPGFSSRIVPRNRQFPLRGEPVDLFRSLFKCFVW